MPVGMTFITLFYLFLYSSIYFLFVSHPWMQNSKATACVNLLTVKFDLCGCVSAAKTLWLVSPTAFSFLFRPVLMHFHSNMPNQSLNDASHSESVKHLFHCCHVHAWTAAKFHNLCWTTCSHGLSVPTHTINMFFTHQLNRRQTRLVTWVAKYSFHLPCYKVCTKKCCWYLC